MTVIAIDSSSRERAWALLADSGGTVIEARAMPGGELDRRLPAVLLELRAGEATAVVVLTGPGSYSGVRAGMAAAVGLALSRSVPLHGLGTLVAIAMEASPADGGVFTVVAGAGRGGVYLARFAAAGNGVTQRSAVVRVSADEVPGDEPVFATEPVAGVTVQQLDPLRVLAASVPRALALAPLTAAGLTAVHAEPGPPA